jgi:hypothetical protein
VVNIKNCQATESLVFAGKPVQEVGHPWSVCLHGARSKIAASHELVKFFQLPRKGLTGRRWNLQLTMKAKPFCGGINKQLRVRREKALVDCG